MIKIKRETKNKQSIRKIMDGALQEFGENGYGLSSINTICNNGCISKGVLYHHFKNKDELYIACVEECFYNLTIYLKKNALLNETNVEKRLQSYFDIRFIFFKENPLYQKIFCSAIISPPMQLITEIVKAKKDFDTFNTEILTNTLEQVNLQPNITINEVVETFKSFQDFTNAQLQMDLYDEKILKEQEQIRKRSLQILLYGVIERKDK